MKSQQTFIDFQGGMEGLFQYDLASLLIDPYVDLTEKIQEVLFEYAKNIFISFFKADTKKDYYKKRIKYENKIKQTYERVEILSRDKIEKGDGIEILQKKTPLQYDKVIEIRNEKDEEVLYTKPMAKFILTLNKSYEKNSLIRKLK